MILAHIRGKPSRSEAGRVGGTEVAPPPRMLAGEVAPIKQPIGPPQVKEEQDDFVLGRIAPIPQEGLKK